MAWYSFKKKDKTIPPAFVREYEAIFNQKIPSKESISQLSFTVLDTETTGFDTRKDYIISYGSVKVIGYSIKINTVQELFLKPKKQGREAIIVHGIIKAEGIIPLEVFVKEFLQDIQGSILVAHHAGFDKALLERTCRAFGLKKLKNPVLDTLDLAIRLEIGKNYHPKLVNMQNYSLDNLCERYHIPLEDRHTASGDAFLTAQLLVKLLKFAETKGIKTFGDLMGR